MEKTIGAFEIRRKFGQILQSILGGDKFIIQWHGQPVAAFITDQFAAYLPPATCYLYICQLVQAGVYSHKKS